MTGTVATVETDHTSVKKIKWTWTSAAGGAASDTTVGYYSGEVLCVVTDPGATAPTADYDLTITDSDGPDILTCSLSFLTIRKLRGAWTR